MTTTNPTAYVADKPLIVNWHWTTLVLCPDGIDPTTGEPGGWTLPVGRTFDIPADLSAEFDRVMLPTGAVRRA